MERNNYRTNLSFSEFKNRVTHHIINMIMRHGQVYNKENPFLINYVGFWVEEVKNEDTGEINTVLFYTSHPSSWNKNTMIEELEMIERDYMVKIMGVNLY